MIKCARRVIKGSLNNVLCYRRPAPKNEEEMMEAIFECIDRLFRIVRPRKLLYMAIDGVVSISVTRATNL